MFFGKKVSNFYQKKFVLIEKMSNVFFFKFKDKLKKKYFL